MKIALLIALAIFLLHQARTHWVASPPAHPAAAVAGVSITLPESGPVAAATHDLANRLSLEVRDIAVVSATPRTWTDTCLGLPQPGEGCSRTSIEGYEIVLRARGSTYAYRTDETGAGLRPIHDYSSTQP